MTNLAEIRELHPIIAGVTGGRAEFYVTQHYLEGCVVDSARKVEVELVHRSLGGANTGIFINYWQDSCI